MHRASFRLHSGVLRTSAVRKFLTSYNRSLKLVPTVSLARQLALPRVARSFSTNSEHKEESTLFRKRSPMYWGVYALIAVAGAYFLFGRKKKGPAGPDTFEKHVLPHGPLQELIPGRMWQVEGSLKQGPDRNMAVFKMPTGGLLLHSVVALDPAGMRKLESLGQPEAMIVPNGFHRADAKVYADRYPGMSVLAPAEAQRKVEEVVKTTASCEDFFRDKKYGVTPLKMDGIKAHELCYDVDCGPNSRVLVFTDALFNITKPVSGMNWLMGTLFGSLGPLHVSRLGRWLMMGDKTKFSSWLIKQSNSGDIRVISVAHGSPVTIEPNQELRRAAQRLTGGK